MEDAVCVKCGKPCYGWNMDWIRVDLADGSKQVVHVICANQMLSENKQPPEKYTPLDQRIFTILQENISIASQVNGYIVHGAVQKIKELIVSIAIAPKKTRIQTRTEPMIQNDESFIAFMVRVQHRIDEICNSPQVFDGVTVLMIPEKDSLGILLTYNEITI